MEQYNPLYCSKKKDCLQDYKDFKNRAYRFVIKKSIAEGKQEVKAKAAEEQSYLKILRSILGDKAEKTIEKIKEKGNLYDFFQRAKENSIELENIIEKKDSQKILDILKTQKKKKFIIKKEIRLSGINSDGINDIKNAFKNLKNAKIKYISGGKYSIETEADDIKQQTANLGEFLKKLKKGQKIAEWILALKRSK